MHSSLVVTPGRLAARAGCGGIRTRQSLKGTTALKRKINPTRVPIEEKESQRWLDNLKASTAQLNAPQRCVHIGDRESDIYELFCAAHDAGTHFLFRTCVDRLAQDGTQTIADLIEDTPCKGKHTVQVRDRNGNVEYASRLGTDAFTSCRPLRRGAAIRNST